MERVYVSMKRDVRSKDYPSVFLILLSFVVFMVGALFMRGAYNESRDELIERLKKEHEVAEANYALKTELAGITRQRYLEFKAKEKLGLMKPKEEEVLVLR